jgi:hypothetical protein
MAMTYTDLKNNVEQITEMDFTNAQLDMFTRQAEQKIYGFIKDLPILKKTTSVTFNASSGATLPANFLYMHSVVQRTGADNTGRKALIQKDYDWLLEAYTLSTETVPDDVSIPEVKYYALDGSDTGQYQAARMVLRVAPKWDKNVTVIYEYQYHPYSIVNPGTTTQSDGTVVDNEIPWLGTNYDSALLNGVLIEAARFMKAEPDILQLYDQQYTLAMQQLMDSVNRLGSDSFRPTTAPPQPLTVPAPAQPPQRQE